MMEIYDLAWDRNDKFIKMDDIKASSMNAYRLVYSYFEITKIKIMNDQQLDIL